MLSKCYLLLVALSAISIASFTGVVNAGSKFSKDISQHTTLQTNSVPIIPVVEPINVQKPEVPIKKSSMNFPLTLRDFYMFESIEEIKKRYRNPISLEGRILPEQSSDTYRTITDMYGEGFSHIASTKNNLVVLYEKVNESNPIDRQSYAVKVKILHFWL